MPGRVAVTVYPESALGKGQAPHVLYTAKLQLCPLAPGWLSQSSHNL